MAELRDNYGFRRGYYSGRDGGFTLWYSFMKQMVNVNPHCFVEDFSDSMYNEYYVKYSKLLNKTFPNYPGEIKEQLELLEKTKKELDTQYLTNPQPQKRRWYERFRKQRQS